MVRESRGEVRKFVCFLASNNAILFVVSFYRGKESVFKRWVMLDVVPVERVEEQGNSQWKEKSTKNLLFGQAFSKFVQTEIMIRVK